MGAVKVKINFNSKFEEIYDFIKSLEGNSEEIEDFYHEFEKQNPEKYYEYKEFEKTFDNALKNL